MLPFFEMIQIKRVRASGMRHPQSHPRAFSCAARRR
jgi:hypothetical protein